MEIKAQKTNELTNKESNERNYENSSLDALKKFVGFRIKKVLLLRHAKNMQQTHLSAGTVPKQMFTTEFPSPYKKTSKFLKKYDELISKTQTQMLHLMIDDIDESIIILETDIDLLKSCLLKLLNNEEQLKYIQRTRKQTQKTI